MGIHNYDVQIKGALKRLNDCSALEVNKQYILSFYDYLRAVGLSKARINRYLQYLKSFSESVSKDFKLLDKDDVLHIVGELESNDYTAWTKVTYKTMLKKFLTWLHDSEEPPGIVSWIKFRNVKTKRLPEELLTQDEIKQMISVCKNARDKALVSTLYESGCRIGELGNLLVKHVSFDKYGAILLVNGKTGQRRVRIISSVPYLAEWLNHHPIGAKPNDPLWASLPPRKGLMIDYANICRIIRTIAQRAGVTKRVNPHSFRHARATHLCNHLAEAQMKEYFGWTQDSRMASVYIHLSGRDVDKALLKINGIEVEEDDKSDVLSLIICPRCEFKNVPTNKYCGKCGLVLSVEESMSIERMQEDKDKLLNLLINDPEVKKLLIEKAKVMMNG